VFNTIAARRHRGSTVVPLLDIGASSLGDAREIVDYYDERARRMCSPVAGALGEKLVTGRRASVPIASATTTH